MSKHPETEEHDLGLSHDLPTIVSRRLGRRSLVGLFGGVGVVAVAGCATGTGTGTDSTAAASEAGLSGAPSGGPGGTPPDGGGGGAPGAESDVEVAEGEIPEETAGPYPGDGSNGVNVLTESGIVRSDLAASFGDATGVAEGVPVSIALRVYDLEGVEATPLAGAAVYLWHCNRDGLYSMYDAEVVEENYLRGVQESDADGNVAFTSIFPGAYDGRWPHMHFEVYRTLGDATSYTNKLRTSQLALPQEACDDVYANADGYEASVSNMTRTSLDSDNVFSDGHSLQLATAVGSAADGYAISLNIPV